MLAGQARYAVIDEAQLSRLTREPEFAELAVVGDIGYPQLLRVATRRDWPELAMVVDQALRSLPQVPGLVARALVATAVSALGESPGFWQNLSILLGLLLAGRAGGGVPPAAPAACAGSPAVRRPPRPGAAPGRPRRRCA